MKNFHSLPNLRDDINLCTIDNVGLYLNIPHDDLLHCIVYCLWPSWGNFNWNRTEAIAVARLDGWHLFSLGTWWRETKKFKEHLNDKHPTIKFTTEYQTLINTLSVTGLSCWIDKIWESNNKTTFNLPYYPVSKILKTFEQKYIFCLKLTLAIKLLLKTCQ